MSRTTCAACNNDRSRCVCERFAKRIVELTQQVQQLKAVYNEAKKFLAGEEDLTHNSEIADMLSPIEDWASADLRASVAAFDKASS